MIDIVNKLQHEACYCMTNSSSTIVCYLKNIHEHKCALICICLAIPYTVCFILEDSEIFAAEIDSMA